MNKALLCIGAFLIGGAGGAAAYVGANYFSKKPVEAPAAVEMSYVPLGPLVLPVTDQAGAFLGYRRFELALGVNAGDEEVVGTRVPEVIDRLNREVWRVPLALDASKATLDLDRLKRIVLAAARAQPETSSVRVVLVTAVSPSATGQ